MNAGTGNGVSARPAAGSTVIGVSAGGLGADINSLSDASGACIITGCGSSYGINHATTYDFMITNPASSVTGVAESQNGAILSGGTRTISNGVFGAFGGGGGVQGTDVINTSGMTVKSASALSGTFTEPGSLTDKVVYIYKRAAANVIAVDLSGAGTYTPYTDFAQGWNTAVGELNTANTKVKLLSNWEAPAATDSFGTGIGFGDGTASGTGYIYVPNGKTVTLDLNGKNIDRNLSANLSNGESMRVEGALTLMDGSTTDVAQQGCITGGFDAWAAGVNITGGRLTMLDGRITGKNNNDGYGVYVMDLGAGASIGEFIMSDGQISGNANGVAVFGGNFALSGAARITNNAGRGVYMTSGSFTLSGAACVTGNTGSNVYLLSGETITLSGALTDGAAIGVTTATEPPIGAPIAIAAGGVSPAYTITDADKGKFTSDRSGYRVVRNNGTNTLQLESTTEPENAAVTPTAAVYDKYTAAAGLAYTFTFTVVIGNAVVSGVVTTGSLPVAGATVEIRNQSGDMIAQTTTDGNGQYSIAGLTISESYTIVITPNGGTPVQKPLEVNSSAVTDDIALPVSNARSGGVHSSAGGGISGGAGNQYVGVWNGGTVTVQASFENLQSVAVDNRTLTIGTDCTVVKGSTVVTLMPTFLAALKDGTHTIRVQFTDGQYNGAFTTPLNSMIDTTASLEVPATGGAPLWALSLAIITLLGAAYLCRRA